MHNGSSLSRTITMINMMIMVMILFKMISIDACQRDNRQLKSCLHTYLERDFFIIEELLKRPPYTQHGHILIDEREFDQWCLRLNDLQQCYQSLVPSCQTFQTIRHMKRTLKTIRSIFDQFCGRQFLVRFLIEGGYCIEYARKESDCISVSVTDPYGKKKVPEKQQWPLSLVSMLRFEVGVKICPYLYDLNECLVPYIDRRCRNSSKELWNSTMEILLTNWCDQNGFKKNFIISKRLIFLISLISILFSIYSQIL
ncbi:hypothetical protein SSS_09908 [Sarcoptes scabiei]|uniref:Uncharacterized protein n=1 Tax=Sarcoptes scabiei TaxID=52283 RepID=A0A834RBA4_SARSC|nr:hypothetical protein SSS_09908 [Sarcoptes scabiei]